MTMKVIKPTVITDAMFVSSTIPETDFTAWNAATSYTVGTKVMRAVSGVHRNFENLIAGVDATLPELATTGATPRWLDLGATNRWAMFDSKVGTISSATLDLTTVLTPGSISGLAALGLTGKTLQVQMKNSTGGTIVYDKTISLDGTTITSFYEWFYEDFQQLSDVTLTDLPSQYYTPEVTFKLTSTSGTVSCGVFTLGKASTLGLSQYGATVGIISYSVKQTDIFGNTTVVKRQNSKRNNLKLMTDKALFSRTYNLLAELDSVPCVYIGAEAIGYEPLIVYGFWKDFSIDVSYPTMNLTNIEIEGLI